MRYFSKIRIKVNKNLKNYWENSRKMQKWTMRKIRNIIWTGYNGGSEKISIYRNWSCKICTTIPFQLYAFTYFGHHLIDDHFAQKIFLHNLNSHTKTICFLRWILLNCSVISQLNFQETIIQSCFENARFSLQIHSKYSDFEK